MLAAACTTSRHQQQVRAAAVVGGRHPRCTSSREAHRAADGELIAHGRARYYTVRSSRTHHHRHHVPVRAIIIAAAGGTAARRRRRRASPSSSCVVVPVWAVGDRRGGGGGNDNDNDDAFVEMDRQTHGSIIFDRKTGRTEHADPKQRTTLRESVVMHTFYHPNIRGGEHAAWASRAVGAAAALVAFVAVAWWWKHTINVLWQKDKAGDDLEGNPAPTTTTSATTAGAIQVNDNDGDDTLKRDQEILRRRTAVVLGIVKPEADDDDNDDDNSNDNKQKHQEEEETTDAAAAAAVAKETQERVSDPLMRLRMQVESAWKSAARQPPPTRESLQKSFRQFLRSGNADMPSQTEFHEATFGRDRDLRYDGRSLEIAATETRQQILDSEESRLQKVRAEIQNRIAQAESEQQQEQQQQQKQEEETSSQHNAKEEETHKRKDIEA